MSKYNPKEIMNDAVACNYAVAAFNISTLDSLQAVLWAAEQERSPIFVQVLGMTEDYARRIDPFLKSVHAYLDDCTVPVVLQHDHCVTAEQARQAIDRGYQAVMFDGSALPYEENVRQTAQVVDYAHRHGVWVEAELGCIPSLEDREFTARTVRTDPVAADAFIQETGCDCLAVSIGTAHGGVAGKDYLPMDFDRLQALQQLRPTYPFVLHGAASLPHAMLAYVNLHGGQVEEMHICSETDIAKACKMGIHKANMDVDNWLAFTGAIRQYLQDVPQTYYPVSYLAYGRDAWEQEARHKIRSVAGCAGMADHFQV